jgi:hypothetical protein
VSRGKLDKTVVGGLTLEAFVLLPVLLSGLRCVRSLLCVDVSRSRSFHDVLLTTRLEYSGYWVCLHQNTTAVTTSILLGVESLAVVANFFASFLVGAGPDILKLRAVVVRSCNLDVEILEGHFAFSAPSLEASSV